MDETISYPRGTKLGRPPAIMLLPQDAAIVRDAVKAATRYYGIQQQDLGSWVTAAMRKSVEMSVETAERLFRLVQQPDASLVKGKPAKGIPLLELQTAIERHREDPGNNPWPQDPAMDYILKMFEAAKVVNNHAKPMPGSTLFVVPGTSQRMAEELVESFVDELSNETFSEQLQRRLVDHLSFYFKVAERPLKEVENKALLDKLRTLGMLNRVDLANEAGKSFPEEELYDP
ncbi:MAG: hypothetical protein WA728_02150, partial [Xanthobacteraceae bacterium]